jgi:hypothetical protein
MRHKLGGICRRRVVVIADKVDATDDTFVGIIGGDGGGSVVGRVVGRLAGAAKILVDIIDAAVDNADLDPLARRVSARRVPDLGCPNE